MDLYSERKIERVEIGLKSNTSQSNPARVCLDKETYRSLKVLSVYIPFFLIILSEKP